MLFDNPYYIHLLETIMIYAILLFGLDIVVGYTGQVSLGHAGLFGLGAYATGVLVLKLGAALVHGPGQRSVHGGLSARCWPCRRCA
jgi:ABC-type branched-subunit amino acid transport system permease subunit